MKKVFSLLFTYIFLQVQLWAHAGGPDYGAISNTVTGTYAGVLTGNIGVNGLGLFELGQPASGIGSGTFAFYAGGGAFFGTIVGLADGERNTLSGIFKGSLKSSSANFNVFGNSTSTLIDVALIGGQFVTRITGGSNFGGGARIIGTASVTVTGTFDSLGNSLLPPGITPGTSTFTVDGFQQSSAVTGQVSLSSLTGTTSTN